MIETDVIKQESLPASEVGSRYVLDVSEPTLYDLGQFLKRRLGKLRDLRERSDWEREKAFAFNAYHMIARDRPLPYVGAANFPCPLPRIGVDSFHANVMSSLFPIDNQMVIKPQIIQKDYASKAQKAAQYMTYVMNHEADAYMQIDDWDHKAQTYGIGYIEPTYVKEEIWETVDITKTTKEPMVDNITGEMKMVEKTSTHREKKKKTVFDGVKLRTWPVESIYKSPFFTTLKQCVKEDVVFKIFNITWDEVQSRSKSAEGTSAFYRKTQVEKIRPSIVEKTFKQLSELEQARASKDGFYLDTALREEMVEMAQAYLWYDIDGDGIKEEITASFHPATATVVRVSLSKCRIVENIPRPVDERGYGEGIPKAAQSLSDEWEVFHNTRANAGQWENTVFGFYRSGGRLNPQQITIQPGHFYPVDDPREVSFANPPRVGSSYFQEEQMIVNYFERVFALDENMQGVGSSRRRTATESIKVASRSSVRFGNPFSRTVTAVNELLGHIWELSRECAPEQKEFFIVGEGGSPLFDKMEKYDYNSNMKFGVAVQSTFDQQMMRDTIMLAYRLFMANPYVQQHPEVLWNLSQKTLDTLNIDIDLPKPPQAMTLSPFEEHDLFQRGEDPEPEVGEDYDHHLKIHELQLNSEDIENWDHEAVKKLVMHRDKTKILKQTLESANLNKSGVFPGMPGGQNDQQQPGVTSNRNPTQAFNTMRVGESSASSKQNLKNGQKGQVAPQQGQPNESMDQIMGSAIS